MLPAEKDNSKSLKLKSEQSVGGECLTGNPKDFVAGSETLHLKGFWRRKLGQMNPSSLFNLSRLLRLNDSQRISKAKPSKCLLSLVPVNMQLLGEWRGQGSRPELPGGPPASCTGGPWSGLLRAPSPGTPLTPSPLSLFCCSILAPGTCTAYFLSAKRMDALVGDRRHPWLHFSPVK